MRWTAMCAAAAVATTTAAVLVAVAPGGAVSAAPAPRDGGRAGPGAAAYDVTLVTGDRVRATQGADRSWSLAVLPARRQVPVGFARSQVRHGSRVDWYLVPTDAAQLVRSGALDRELFNVTGLIRQGYDDAHSKEMPLLVQYASQATADRAPAAAGASVERTLPSLSMRALAEHKSSASAYWGQLTASAAAARPRHVWLNATFHAALDQSVPLVGAPAAWQAGLTGKGVTVAVLDTGIDAGHPDFAGRIGPSRDFTGVGSTDDDHGHGTHVASTVAGSGAASGGRFRGVAPDATLAIGKVLDRFGDGQVDEVLAGMQWAAADVHARVVNMSLGADPTDGTDPVAQALNALSTRYGTLFVVAAGNFGGDETVGTPASADAALAVGSTTKGDELSDFSSRGPRVFDGAVKPEIAAPGSDIVAARAHDSQIGEVVDDRYQRLSGTSMATPHVTGAAAILAQQHPDWTGEQLKSALVGSAHALPGLGAFQVGAGRLDVAHAVAQPVTASPAAVNSYLRFPSTAPQERTVTYRNSGSAPVTLSLALSMAGPDGSPAPAALARLSATSLTVPAGGTAAVTLTAARSGTPAKYGGVLVASAAGGIAVRTPVAVFDEPPMYDLDLRVLDRNGVAPSGAGDSIASVELINPDTGDAFFGTPGVSRLPAGRYAVVGLVTTPVPDGSPSVTMFADPSLQLARDTVLTIDARRAHRTAVTVDQPAARGGVSTPEFMVRTKPFSFPFGFTAILDPRFGDLFTYSVPGVSSPDFALVHRLNLVEPDLELFADRPRFELVAGWFRDSDVPLNRRGIRVVVGGQGRPEDLAGKDLHGRLTLLGIPGDTTVEEVFQRIANVKAAGGDLVGLYVLPDGAASPPGAGVSAPGDDPATGPVLPTLRLFGAQAQRFARLAAAGRLTVDVTTRAASRFRYELGFTSVGSVPARGQVRRVHNAELAALPVVYHSVPGQSFAPTSISYYHTFGTRESTSFLQPTLISGRRLEYYTPGVWDLALSGFTSPSAPGLTLRRGLNRPLPFSRAAIGPCFGGGTTDDVGEPRRWAIRAGDTVDVVLPMYCDSAGHAEAPVDFNGDSGSTSLYAGDRLIGTSTDQPGRGVFPVPAGPGTYRLVADVHNDEGFRTLSGTVHAEWTFRTGGEGVLPLLSVQAVAPVDLANAAPSGRPLHIPITVSRQDGPVRATSVRAEISYDDGGTWTPLPLTRSGGTWTATVTHRSPGFASLRLSATDSDGNSVAETLTRAYQIT